MLISCFESKAGSPRGRLPMNIIKLKCCNRQLIAMGVQNAKSFNSNWDLLIPTGWYPTSLLWDPQRPQYRFSPSWVICRLVLRLPASIYGNEVLLPTWYNSKAVKPVWPVSSWLNRHSAYKNVPGQIRQQYIFIWAKCVWGLESVPIEQFLLSWHWPSYQFCQVVRQFVCRCF